MNSMTQVRYLDRATPPHISTLILLSGMAALAMNIFLPSLPKMTEYFDTEYGLMQLSVAVYLAVNAGLQLVIGPISDTFGRRKVILFGIGLFCLATLGCLIATNIWVFLGFRMMQAVIATAMVLSRAVVRDMYPQDRAASMIGYVTMGMSVVPMIGPMIGGLLDELMGWQANFWLLLGFGLALFVLAWRDLGETAQSSGLTLRQQFGEYPELTRSPRFWGYAMAAGFSSGSFFAYVGGAPFVGSVVFGLSPSELGLFFGFPALGYFAGNFFTARFATRFGINKLILWGCLCVTFGIGLALILFALGLGNAFVFFGSMSFVGIGNGLSLPNATAGLLSVRPHLAGTASGLGGSFQIGMGAALSALAGALLVPEWGPWPLLLIQFATSVLAVCSILMVIRRERKVFAQPL
ncbi:multidrug effflux MFS transporter [Primorskyibacter marinus]|uniref:multidrug effflux MFS transporter n=1 Tax=Primorskyibacter marinus TaxID=1977320 RepID=UPI000E305FB4|nr:multidrug effflux MFS transporter [Primorskyibacter marinus]